MIPVSRLLTLALAATAVGCGHHRCACNAPGSQGEQHRILSATPAPAGQNTIVTTGRQPGVTHTTAEPPVVLPGSAAAEPAVTRDVAAAAPAGVPESPAIAGIPGAPGQIVDPDGRVIASVVVVTQNDPAADLSRILAATATVPDGPAPVVPAVAAVPETPSLVIPAFAGTGEEPAEPLFGRRRGFTVQVTATPTPVASPVPGTAPAPAAPVQPAVAAPAGVALPAAAPLPGSIATDTPLPEADPNCRHAHAADYSWVVGELRYLHTRKCWQVRYAPLEVEDDYGGSFLLTGADHLMGQFHEGQIVKVSGVILRPERHSASTMYWTDHIKPLR